MQIYFFFSSSSFLFPFFPHTGPITRYLDYISRLQVVRRAIKLGNLVGLHEDSPPDIFGDDLH